jgi:hypothetical protein
MDLEKVTGRSMEAPLDHYQPSPKLERGAGDACLPLARIRTQLHRYEQAAQVKSE